ncbi:MAG: aminoacyl-histidine dipeptidase [Promethearchaeota archaeon]|nr:MAG: aminoacyl-histidine dipeptidase [Candidatus Lokiarchaeota archaeon]
MSLEDLTEPKEFWEYFDQISKIPRCSGNEKLIRKFIIKEAQKCNYETKTDKVGNLVVRISPNDEEGKIRVVLQSHMDMVCEKNQDVIHDFSKDPLKLKVIEIDKEVWLTAEGTTLGADDGVGIAFQLTMMKKLHNDELNFDGIALDLLFTVDEEIGLVGAFKMDKNLIDGKYLINLDGEEDDKFIIGCAGGITTLGIIDFDYISVREYSERSSAIKISVGGLLGGHSGTDIHRGRANAIKIISKILWKVNNEYPIFIKSINGGNRANAIPREAEATFFARKKDSEKIIEFINLIIGEIEQGISKIEPNMKFTVKSIISSDNYNVLPKTLNEKLLHLLYVMPNGPISMHPRISDLVYTSTNLASINTRDQQIKITTSQRSMHEISKKIIYEKIEALFKLADVNIDIIHTGDYPGWDPDFDSKLLRAAQETYKELFKKEVNTQAIHAGLECGILKKHFPAMEMISIGPTVEGGHSPEERLKIASVEKIWIFLITLLNNLN